MTQQTGTPGPWASFWNGDAVVPADHINRRYGGAEDAALDRDGFAQVICRVKHDRHGRGDRAANARLIASAPALRDALRRLLRAFESDAERVPDQDVRTAWETNSAAVAQARAALASAEPRGEGRGRWHSQKQVSA